MDRKKVSTLNVGKDGDWKWYWLMNRCKNYSSGFAVVGGDGNAGQSSASTSFGVRPVFCLRQDALISN